MITVCGLVELVVSICDYKKYAAHPVRAEEGNMEAGTADFP